MAIIGNDIVALATWGVFHEGDYPAVTDVRQGVLYGNDTYTGTLDVSTPDPSDSGDAGDMLNQLGEVVRYHPYGGAYRSIKAIVDRGVPASLDSMANARTPQITVWVANDATIGISAAEIDIGKDAIEIAARIGETAADRRIARIIDMDNGMDDQAGMMNLALY